MGSAAEILGTLLFIPGSSPLRLLLWSVLVVVSSFKRGCLIHVGCQHGVNEVDVGADDEGAILWIYDVLSRVCND